MGSAVEFALRQGGRLHGVADPDFRLFQELLGPDPRFQDDFDGAVFEGLERGLRTGFRQARTDDHGHRVLCHDLVEEGNAVHARHFHVEGDDVGDLAADLVRCNIGVRRCCHDLDLVVRVEDLLERLAHHRRIIDDEYADFLRHERYLRKVKNICRATAKATAGLWLIKFHSCSSCQVRFATSTFFNRFNRTSPVWV